MTAQAKDSDTRIVDDKIAEARERIGRIEKQAGQPAAGPRAAAEADIGDAALADRPESDLRKASADLMTRIDEARRP